MSLLPSDIGIKLYNLVLENSHDFSPSYEQCEKEFLNWYNKFEGIKNDVRLDLASNHDSDLIKLSLLLSDFTSIFPYHKNSFLYAFNANMGGRRIIGSKKYLDTLSGKNPGSQIFGGYGSVSEELIEDIFKKLYPLINAGKVIIRPEKVIFVANFKDNKFSVLPAEANGQAEEWRLINQSDKQVSYPLFDKKSSIEHHRKISEILIPYIKGIDFEEYSKILLDEEDLLSSFRLQTKAYLQLVKKENIDSEEFRRDLIQPKLDLINRKFKTITNNHRLKTSGATIGTASLLLLSISQVGLIAALSQLISFGLGTVGFIKNEADYQENIGKLKDIPEYLLWQINRKKPH